MIDWDKEWNKIQDRGNVLDRGKVLDGSEVFEDSGELNIENSLYSFSNTFRSHGYDNNIIRYTQAKHSYGLECNMSTVMYLLQSYGLIAKNISREEFEHAYTPLKPKNISKNKNIEINGVDKGKKLIEAFSNILGSDVVNITIGKVTRCEAILRGSYEIPSPLSPSGSSSDILNKIVDEFYRIYQLGYAFSTLKQVVKTKSNFVNIYNDLYKLGKKYFVEGGVAYIGMTLDYNVPYNCSHYALIVKNHLSYITWKNKRFYIYPLDDSWHQRAFIMSPNPFAFGMNKQHLLKYKNFTEHSPSQILYKNQLLFFITPNFAYGQ